MTLDEAIAKFQKARETLPGTLPVWIAGSEWDWELEEVKGFISRDNPHRKYMDEPSVDRLVIQ